MIDATLGLSGNFDMESGSGMRCMLDTNIIRENAWKIWNRVNRYAFAWRIGEPRGLRLDT